MKVAIIMGSNSDWPILEPAEKTLKEFGVEVEVQGVVLLIADVDGLLLDRPGPREGELPAKVHVAVEDVRESVATLRPGEPPSDERVPLVDVVADDEGTPGEHDHDKRDPGGLDPGEHLLVDAAEGHGGAVVGSFRARLLGNDGDDDVVALSTLTGGAVSDLCTSLVDGLLKTAEKSGPASDVTALTLP